MGGRGVQRITLDLTVTDLPEPSPILLIAVAALAGFGVSRRAPRAAKTAVSLG